MRNYKHLLIIASTICVILLNPAKAAESMLSNKPYFTLRIETKNTLYLAKINGAVVFDDNSSGNMLSAEIPVNYYMRTGKNKISLDLFPNGEEEFLSSNIALSLFVNKDGEPEENKKLISKLIFDGSKHNSNSSIKFSTPSSRLDSSNHLQQDTNGDVIIYNAEIKPGTIMPGTISVSQIIELETPFPKWGFLDSEKIDFPLSYAKYLEDEDLWDKKTIKPLYNEHKNLYELLKTNNIDRVLELFKERNSEYDLAMYYPEGTYDKKLRKSLSKDLANLNLKLRPFESALPYISDEKNLIKLGNVGLIYFVNDNETSFTNYEISFYKKDGKWIISR